MWSGPLHPERSQRSDTVQMMDIITWHGLQFCLKPGEATFLSPQHHMTSTIDLIFASIADLAPRILRCNTMPGHGSDHLGLFVHLRLETPRTAFTPRPLYKLADWKAFPTRLEAYFKQNPLPSDLFNGQGTGRLCGAPSNGHKTCPY